MKKETAHYKERIRKLKSRISGLKREMRAKTKAWGKSQAELVSAVGELKRRAEELEKFEKFTIGRELKMVELKKRIRELEKG